jgi:hypothetical protein
MAIPTGEITKRKMIPITIMARATPIMASRFPRVPLPNPGA